MERRDPDAVHAMPVCAGKAVKVMPTEALPPWGQYLAHGRMLSKVMGICGWHAAGEARTILEHVARHAFWELPLHTLNKVARGRGVVGLPPQALTRKPTPCRACLWCSLPAVLVAAFFP